jgi:hypothetical protein
MLLGFLEELTELRAGVGELPQMHQRLSPVQSDGRRPLVPRILAEELFGGLGDLLPSFLLVELDNEIVIDDRIGRQPRRQQEQADHAKENQVSRDARHHPHHDPRFRAMVSACSGREQAGIPARALATTIPRSRSSSREDGKRRTSAANSPLIRFPIGRNALF